MGAPGVKHATGALREFSNVGGKPASEREDFSESNYDEWSGYGGSLFTNKNKHAPAPGGGFMGVDDAEDNEADNVFSKVDEYMDSRRNKKRDEKTKEVEVV